jgi:hypothetical protein
MLRFKFLLWMLTKLLRRAIRTKPDAARHVSSKDVTFQIRTTGGAGRHYRIASGRVTSSAGLEEASPDFTLTFSTGAAGFRILSAKDAKGAFLQGLHDGELTISGDFVKVMWFQRLADFLQPDK